MDVILKRFENITAEGKNIKPFEMFKDLYFNYIMENKLNNKKSFSYDKSISLAEKEKEMNKVLLYCVEEAVGMKKPEMISFEAWATDPTVQHRTFAIVDAMVEAVLPDTLIDSIGVYADIRNAGWGDSFAFNVKPRSLFTVTGAGRAIRRAFIQKQYGTTVTLSPYNHQVTVGASLYRMLAGKESLAEFAMKAVRAIETQVTYECYEAFAAAFTTAGFPAGLAIASYNQNDAITLAQKVTAWNGGNKAVFVGTQNALNKILPANANYRYDFDSDYVKVGYLQAFGGYDTLVLPQIADYNSNDFGLKLDDTKVYVISPSADKLVKLGLEGSTLSYADKIDTNANLEQTVTFNKSFDAQVVTSAIAGYITVG